MRNRGKLADKRQPKRAAARKQAKAKPKQSPRSALGKYMVPGGMGHLG